MRISCLLITSLLATPFASLPAFGQTADPAEVPAAILAQAPPSPVAPIPTAEEDEFLPNLQSSGRTQTDARTINMKIPAPRGQITDRNGFPLAQNEVRHYLAISFPRLEDPSDAQILTFAREQLGRVNKKIGVNYQIPGILSEADVLDHYKHRRWLPLLVPGLLTKVEHGAIEPLVTKDGKSAGLTFQPTYVRIYPRGSMAPHILGVTKKIRPMPTGSISPGDPLWPETEGRDGLEKTFNEYLTGKDGEINYLFDSEGNRLQEYIVAQPEPGANIVTSLDAELQEIAEKALARHVGRGAFVCIEVGTGDVLAMASYPNYDPNEWVPAISQERFTELNEDSTLPLLARSFRGLYPPASTFKIPVAMAALETETVGRWSEFACPPSMRINGRRMKNWNKKHDGSLNVVGAIKRSCNPWFFQVARKMGADPFLSMARRVGLGEATGLPLAAEAGGRIPDSSNDRVKTASLSIGQDQILTSPLQVARMMAAIADGRSTPVPRLVLQIQDLNNDVIKAFPEEKRNDLNCSIDTMNTVRKGMYDVVHAGDGTGKRASISYAKLCGKTGTGQWSGGKYVAWFAGFVPYKNPRYAFAALYEGRPGQTVSGGKNAAPIVKSVMNKMYARGINKRIQERRLAVLAGTENPVEAAEEEKEKKKAAASKPKSKPKKKSKPKPKRKSVPRAIPVPPPPPPAEKKGFFKRLFGR